MTNSLNPELEEEDTRKYTVRLTVRIDTELRELIRARTRNKRLSRFVRNCIRVGLRAQKKV